ncbi:MAG: hypothetical protein C4302_09210 [Thermus sp.]
MEAEDPFVPEEKRLPPSLPPLGLPKRLSGDGWAFLQELLHRGDEATVVSYPEADDKGPTFPIPHLPKASPAPPLPAASREEVHPEDSPWRPKVFLRAEELKRVALESAQEIFLCPGRFALKRLFREKKEGAWGRLLGYAHRERGGVVLDPKALEQAKQDHPEWAGFLEAERPRLLGTRFWISIPLSQDPPLYALAGGVNEAAKEVYALEEGNRARLSESYLAQREGLAYRVWPFGKAPEPLEPLEEWRVQGVAAKVETPSGGGLSLPARLGLQRLSRGPALPRGVRDEGDFGLGGHREDPCAFGAFQKSRGGGASPLPDSPGHLQPPGGGGAFCPGPGGGCGGCGRAFCGDDPRVSKGPPHPGRPLDGARCARVPRGVRGGAGLLGGGEKPPFGGGPFG